MLLFDANEFERRKNELISLGFPEKIAEQTALDEQGFDEISASDLPES